MSYLLFASFPVGKQEINRGGFSSRLMAVPNETMPANLKEGAGWGGK